MSIFIKKRPDDLLISSENIFNFIKNNAPQDDQDYIDNRTLADVEPGFFLVDDVEEPSYKLIRFKRRVVP